MNVIIYRGTIGYKDSAAFGSAVFNNQQNGPDSFPIIFLNLANLHPNYSRPASFGWKQRLQRKDVIAGDVRPLAGKVVKLIAQEAALLYMGLL